VGAVNEEGRATERGRRMARVGVHPRLARALLDGAEHVGDRAAEVVALLSDDRRTSDDLVLEWRAKRRDAQWREEVRRLRRALPAPSHAGRTPRPDAGGSGPRPDAAGGGSRPDAVGRDGGTGSRAARGGKAARPGASRTGGETGRGGGETGRGGGGALTDEETVAGIVVAFAFPERVARARDGGYLMASGTAAVPAKGSRLGGAEWLAIAVADRPAGAPAARIRQAVPIDVEIARLAVTAVIEDEVEWRDGDVVARRVERLGAIELGAVPLTRPDPDRVRAALREGLRKEGLGLLTWTRDAEALRSRLAFCHRALGSPWPAMTDEALLGSLDLSATARGRADLRRLDVSAALRGLLPWECAARLDEVAPERVTVPSGSRIRIGYEAEQPVLAAKLQELFGWQETPRVAGVPLVVHLLSPAGRPAAVTTDLASFWREGYRSVRAELRGRYPRHPWPEDPATAEPTRRANPRRR
ncbi:MAG: ATP-dependent helicase C-terminal domain-containing protein, partial [Actinoallomurus sp.]